MSLTTPYREQFLEADGITTTFPFDDHGDGFDAISKNYIKCEVYNADGSVIVPDFTPDMSAKTITITSLTTPDGQVLNAPQNGAIVRIYRDVPEAQNTTAQALQASTAQQIVQNFDNIVAMIQELQYANEHFTLRSTLPQRDLQIDLLRDIDDQKLVYWDNEKRKLVVTNYRQDELLLPEDKEDILEQANAYSDEKNAQLETKIDGKLTAVNASIDANADAIQKTREDFASADQAIRADMNQADGEIHDILNSHTSELTTLRGNQASLGDQVSGIEEKIPGDASATNQLATKADLANVDLDGYVKKSGDTMTGDLVFDMGIGGLSIGFNGLYEIVNTGQIVPVQKHIDADSQIKGFTFYEVRNNAPVMQYNMTEQGFYCLRGDNFLGTSNYPWEKIYAKKLNNGADITIPTLGGTLARLEDLIDLRADINEADSELQTQITAQAAEIATKQDQLVAGDNIIISNNVISATGAGGGAGFDVQVVQELPATGQKGIIYLLAKDGAAPDVYDEYVWIETTQTFELIGTTQVDLTDYATKEELSGYLPLSGGTVSGPLGTEDKLSIGLWKVSAVDNGNVLAISRGAAGRWLNFDYNSGAIYPMTLALSLGNSATKWTNVFTKKLNNGEDIAIPTVGGTMARLEDIKAIGGDGTAGQVLTKTADGMAWQDASGGSSLPDQTGNEGKVLTTDGTNASWTEMSGLIIRRL